MQHYNYVFALLLLLFSHVSAHAADCSDPLASPSEVINGFWAYHLEGAVYIRKVIIEDIDIDADLDVVVLTGDESYNGEPVLDLHVFLGAPDGYCDQTLGRSRAALGSQAITLERVNLGGEILGLVLSYTEIDPSHPSLEAKPRVERFGFQPSTGKFEPVE